MIMLIKQEEQNDALTLQNIESLHVVKFQLYAMLSLQFGTT